MEMECIGIRIDTKNNTPAYEQIFEQIVGAIKKGLFQTGEKLPSETEFCSETGLAKGTVRKAFDKLEAEGYVEKIHGSGTYVLDWRPEYRSMVLFEKHCLREGGSPEESFDKLRSACRRYFTPNEHIETAVIDCTLEIAGDIQMELCRRWDLKTTYYEVGGVRQGRVIPKEPLWITTKSHYEEVLPAAMAAGKELRMVKLDFAKENAEKLSSLKDDCLLGIVYETQDFLMHVSHTLALLGRHNTYYLCQKEEWNDKKKAIRSSDITWLISVQEEEIISQMKALNYKFIIYSYELEKESVEQLKVYMEQRKR